MKKLKYLLVITLLAGTIFAWSTVFSDFIKFYETERSFTKIENCVIPNPVTTPCFYGAFAFLFAFVWSLFTLSYSQEKQKKKYLQLFIFLIAGNIFAWTNFTIILLRFLKAAEQPIVGCSGQITTNPLTTPCFIGASLFFLNLVICGVIVWKNRK